METTTRSLVLRHAITNPDVALTRKEFSALVSAGRAVAIDGDVLYRVTILSYWWPARATSWGEPYAAVGRERTIARAGDVCVGRLGANGGVHVSRRWVIEE
jgi:hypothetical protein